MSLGTFDDSDDMEGAW